MDRQNVTNITFLADYVFLLDILLKLTRTKETQYMINSNA